MKFLNAILITTALTSSSFAATLSCSAMVDAYKQDQMNNGKNTCNTAACKDLKLSQLKKTIAYYTDDKNPQGTLQSLTKEYQAYFDAYTIGSEHFESANIDLGDNGFELLFDAGTDKFSGIEISDGDINVDGKYCEGVEFAPAKTEARLEKICEKVVSLVEAKLPKAQFTQEVCMNKTPVDPKTGNTTDINVSDYDQKTITWRVGRNLADVNGGYLSCSVTTNRSTSEVSATKCDIH